MNKDINKELPSLILCIILDLIGYASFAIPLLGELSDVIWAPISGMIFYKMFGGAKGVFGGIFSFVEEILPFTDFIPTFSLMWLYQYFTKQETSKQLLETSPQLIKQKVQNF
jgi:hypothetical protein